MTETTYRIMFVSTSMGLGGADKQVLDLSRELNKRGHSIKIVSISPLGEMGQELQNEDIEIDTLGVENHKDGITSSHKLLNITNRFNPDIIHSQMFHANLLTRIIQPFTSADVHVSTIQNIYEVSPKKGQPKEKGLREYCYGLTDRLTDLTTNVSKAGLDRYVGVGSVSENKSKVIHNGVYPENYNRNNEKREELRNQYGVDGFVWLAIGRLVPQKDYENMFTAFKRLEGESQLWIIGQGILKENLKEMKSEMGLSNIKFLGTFPPREIPDYMSASDGFVLSSQWEGFGIVNIEAMACELPVVATRSGGPDDIIKNGETGYLCPPKDPRSLAESMNKVMNMQEEEREQMGKKARKRVQENFSIENIADQWQKTYSNVLQ